MRKALPGSTKFEPHPLGLAQLSDDALAVKYSNARFIDPDNNKPNAGLMGATPIIAFETGNSFNTKTEEDTV
jgi:hypothetical protein